MILLHLSTAAGAAHAAAAPAHNNGTWIIDAIIFGGGLLCGRLWGRKSGLKHLGQAEFNARWRNVRSVRRF
jgi:hypothetical protein